MLTDTALKNLKPKDASYKVTDQEKSAIKGSTTHMSDIAR